MKDDLEKLISNLESLGSENQEFIYINGERIGTGKGTVRNMESKTKLFQTKEKAISHEKFLKFKRGESKKIDESVLEHIIDEIVEKDIFGR